MLPMPLSQLPIALKQCLPSDVTVRFGEGLIQRVTTDSRHIAAGDLFVAIVGETFDGHDFVAQALKQGAICALVAQSWWHKAPAAIQNATLPCLDVMEAFRQLAHAHRTSFNFPVIGIGGSNGKTTTKELLAAALQGRYPGHVAKTLKSENGFQGLAQTIMTTAKDTATKVLVLEIGIDATGAMEQHIKLFQPDIVLLAALAAEHVIGFGTSEKAIAEEFLMFTEGKPSQRIWNFSAPPLWEKSRIAFLDPARDWLVIPAAMKDKFIADVVPLVPAKGEFRTLVWESRDSLADGTTTLDVQDVTTSLTALKTSSEKTSYTFALVGAHNAANGALAIGTARAFGLTPQEIARGLSEHFEAPAQRNVYKTLGQHRILIDDTYNASPASMQSALENLGRGEWSRKHKILFLADMAELGPESRHWHHELAKIIQSSMPRQVVLYGAEMQETYRTLQGLGLKTTWLPREEDPSVIAKSCDIPENSVILVKGSRSMKMERVVQELMVRFPT